MYDEGLVTGGCGKSFMVEVEMLEAMGGILFQLLEGDLEKYLVGFSGR